MVVTNNKYAFKIHWCTLIYRIKYDLFLIVFFAVYAINFVDLKIFRINNKVCLEKFNSKLLSYTLFEYFQFCP